MDSTRLNDKVVIVTGGGSGIGKHVQEDRAGRATPPAKLPRPRAWVPLHRAGDTFTEYGATIAFLLSDDAGFITGTSIVIDGGYLAT